MKIKTIILILLITGLFSCSDDFLQKELLNEINSSVYYSSEDDATGAIIAVYDVLGWYGQSNAGGMYGAWIYRINYSGVDLT